MKSLYEHQKKKHQELMEVLTQVPTEFHKLPFHYWGTETIIIDFLVDKACNLLWHPCLIHCGQHILKDLH